MRTLKLSLLAALIISISSCEEESKESAEVFFSGITNRDEKGDINGNVDPMDWNLNVEFNSRENGLFKPDNLPLCTDAADTNLRVYSYPNPSSGTFIFGSLFQMDSVSLRIVDDNYKVLFKNDGVTSNALSIYEDGDSGSRLVRLYYRFYYNGCKYQGYGDLSIR